MLALFVDLGSCAQVLGEMQTLVSAFPGVRFAAVSIKGERSELRALVRRDQLSFPIGHRQRWHAGAALQSRELPPAHVRLPRRHCAEQGAARAPAAGDVARARERARRRRPRAGLEAAGVSAGGEHSSQQPAKHFQPTRGWCDREVQDELPGLQLVHARAVVGSTGRGSPPALRERLDELSSRWSGPQAINCASALCRRPTGCSSGTSVSTPTRADADRGGDVRAHAAGRLHLEQRSSPTRC